MLGQNIDLQSYTLTNNRKKLTGNWLKSLKQKGFDVNTEIVAAGTFLPVKEYHQDYYYKTNQTPYCHTYKKLL